jgi:high-affinity nickel-transport protein
VVQVGALGKQGRRGNSRVVATLVLIQIVAWLTALNVARDSAAILALAGMAYALGLRHALDADHISAIDNVSRNLVGRGEAATAVGLFFALGHSAAVAGLTLAVSVTTVRLSSVFAHVREWAAVYSTLISVAVLILIAPRNAWAAWQIYRGLQGTSQEVEVRSRPTGLAGRLLQPLLQLHVRSWHMLIVGALFGLGFETATAMSVMALSAARVNGGATLAGAMVVPLLFTAGMTLVDALDGVFMERAYRWACANPRRHARYNLGVTALAALIATAVGAYELVSLVQRFRGGSGAEARALAYVDDHFERIGLAVIALFALGWLGSLLATRLGQGRMSLVQQSKSWRA